MLLTTAEQSLFPVVFLMLFIVLVWTLSDLIGSEQFTPFNGTEDKKKIRELIALPFS